MSVHGYPADQSILLQLETRLTEVTRRERAGTSHADIDQDQVSIPGMLQGAVVALSVIVSP